jgi:uncharacterized protein YcgI (DUF1989 family)
MFIVKKGQTLRVIAVEGPQAADLIVFNEHDMRESYSAWLTRQNSGRFNRAMKLYSTLPNMKVMFTVLNPKDGIFWLSGARCNGLCYETLNSIKGHNSCQDILAGLLQPYGMTHHDVPEILNIFMNVVFKKDGSYKFIASPVDKGGYVDLLAEMDCLVGVSACPDEFGEYNNCAAKPLGIQIIE